jgi:hypothetical protein
MTQEVLWLLIVEVSRSHTIRHTHSVELPSTSDRLFAQAAPYTTHSKHKRQTSIPCNQTDSNPPPQQSGVCRHKCWSARPLSSEQKERRSPEFDAKPKYRKLFHHLAYIYSNIRIPYLAPNVLEANRYQVASSEASASDVTATILLPVKIPPPSVRCL